MDILEIARIEWAIARSGERFLRRVYTDTELECYRSRPASLASRFAAKEAVIKALGGLSEGFSWREIEILSDDSGKPRLNLYGSMRDKALDLGLDSFSVSLSDSREYSVAFVVGNEGQ